MQIRRGRDGGLKLYASTTGPDSGPAYFQARRSSARRGRKAFPCEAAGFVAAHAAWSVLSELHSGWTDQDPAGCAPLGCGDCVGHVDGPPGAVG